MSTTGGKDGPGEDMQEMKPPAFVYIEKPYLILRYFTLPLTLNS
jgi:hypothetical protein